MSEKESSLNDLFLEARTKQEELNLYDPRSKEFSQTLLSAVSSLEACKLLIDQLALFSANEELDDISSQTLQFLAVDYLQAELMMKTYEVNRKTQLTHISQLLEGFLTRLDEYGMLNSGDRKLLERYRDDRYAFTLVSTTDPEQRRNSKIARFQEEKTLKGQLKRLRDQSQQNQVDEEVLRSLYIAELALFVHQSFQSLDMISQELSILASMPTPEPNKANVWQADTDARRNGRQAEGYSERLDGPTTLGGLGQRGGPLLSPSGKPLQPFTLTDKRTQLQKEVFRSGHNLPTMSIDEYLEEEKKRGGIIEGGGNANAPQAEPDEDNMDAVDEATMKARNWDEFVEANPKGAGNTLNRG